MLTTEPPICARSKNADNIAEKPSVKMLEKRRNTAESKHHPQAPSRAIGSSSLPSSPLSTIAETIPPVRPARKVSQSLTKHQVQLISNAAHHAQIIERPLNRFITIDWELAGVADPWEAQSCFIKLIRDWLRWHTSGPATYVWVIENGPQLGLHTHIILHIPPTLVLKFSQMQRRWLKKAGITQWVKGIIYSTKVSHSYWAGFDNNTGGDGYTHNLNRLVDYILKSADPQARQAHGITRPAQYSIVEGKRSGTSRNLGEKAIQDWHRERRHVDRG